METFAFIKLKLQLQIMHLRATGLQKNIFSNIFLTKIIITINLVNIEILIIENSLLWKHLHLLNLIKKSLLTADVLYLYYNSTERQIRTN